MAQKQAVGNDDDMRNRISKGKKYTKRTSENLGSGGAHVAEEGRVRGALGMLKVGNESLVVSGRAHFR